MGSKDQRKECHYSKVIFTTTLLRRDLIFFVEEYCNNRTVKGNLNFCLANCLDLIFLGTTSRMFREWITADKVLLAIRDCYECLIILTWLCPLLRREVVRINNGRAEPETCTAFMPEEEKWRSELSSTQLGLTYACLGQSYAILFMKK